MMPRPTLVKVKNRGTGAGYLRVSLFLRNDGSHKLPQGKIEGTETHKDGTVHGCTFSGSIGLEPGEMTELTTVVGPKVRTITATEYIGTIYNKDAPGVERFPLPLALTRNLFRNFRLS